MRLGLFARHCQTCHNMCVRLCAVNFVASGDIIVTVTSLNRDMLCAVQVVDEEAARFIASCVGDTDQRHTATQLLEDPFLLVRSGDCLCVDSRNQHGSDGSCVPAFDSF